MQQLNSGYYSDNWKEKGRRNGFPLLYNLWIYENMFDDDCPKRQDWLARYPAMWIVIPAVFRHWKDGRRISFTLHRPHRVVEKVRREGPGQPVPDSRLGDEEAVEAFTCTPLIRNLGIDYGREGKRQGRYLLGRWLRTVCLSVYSGCGGGKCPYGFLSVSGTGTSSVCQTDKILYEGDGTCRREAWDVDGFCGRMISAHRNPAFFSLGNFPGSFQALL